MTRACEVPRVFDKVEKGGGDRVVTQLQEEYCKNTVLEWTSIEVHEIVDSDYKLSDSKDSLHGIEGRRARQGFGCTV